MMNDLAIGRALRTLRHRLGWRQSDLAGRAGVSQQLVSRAELGRVASLSQATLRRLFAAVDADVVTLVRWRGGELDRLLDEGHAAVVARVCDLLAPLGWEVLPEVSFAVYGERGSIDVLAWHPASRTLLVIEVKTEVTSVEETLRRHDTKVRLAQGIARERLDVRPDRVARLLVLADTSTNRRRVARLDPILRPAYPMRGRSLRRWLVDPRGPASGLVFTAPLAGGRPARRRVRAS